MGILDLIKRDANRITTDLEGFAQVVTFISPDGEEADVNALHTKHHLGYNFETAQETNTLKAHICVSEQELIDQYYPVRDGNNEVHLENHRVRAQDANGINWTYKVASWFPNDKAGTISVVLGAHVQ